MCNESELAQPDTLGEIGCKVCNSRFPCVNAGFNLGLVC